MSVRVWGRSYRTKETDEGLALHLKGKRITRIKKIEGLDQLANLEVLDISSNLITMIEGLDQLTKLRRLDLSSNQITQIRGLDKLVGLERLSLDNNQITRIEGLNNLTRLRGLAIEGNHISVIEGLGQLTNLRGLYLNNNQITKIQGLHALANLRVLQIEGNQITTIEGLNHLSKLHKIDLGSNPIYPTISRLTAQEIVQTSPVTLEQRQLHGRTPETHTVPIEPSKALIGMIKIQQRVDVNEAAQLLHISPGDVRVLLFTLAADDKVKGQFAGDIFKITSDVDEFVAALDQQFRQWGTKNALDRGKIN